MPASTAIDPSFLARIFVLCLAATLGCQRHDVSRGEPGQGRDIDRGAPTGDASRLTPMSPAEPSSHAAGARPSDIASSTGRTDPTLTTETTPGLVSTETADDLPPASSVQTTIAPGPRRSQSDDSSTVDSASTRVDPGNRVEVPEPPEQRIVEQAAESGPIDAGGSQTEVAVQHPLVEELDKDTYNVLAELYALIDGAAWGEAAELIASLDLTSRLGVAPHPHDPDLIVSLPAAVQLALREHQPLKDELRSGFEDVARLRVRQAISELDFATARAVAVQFNSTEAAAEARRWLGDLELASGRFRAAIDHYQRASLNTPVELQAALRTRIELAAAMLGEDGGQSESLVDLQLAGESVSAADLRRMMEEMIQRKSDDRSPSASDRLNVDQGVASTYGSLTCLIDRALSAHVDFRSAGADGQRISLQFADHQVLLNDWMQVVSFDANHPSPEWTSRRPVTGALNQPWSFRHAPRPLVTPDRLYIRQLVGQDVVLKCLDRQSGEAIWTAELEEGRWLASDPLMIDQSLFALTILRTEQKQNLLSMTEFSVESGAVVWQSDLVRLRWSWWERRHCAVTTSDDVIIASLGGVVICFDSTGNLHWIRRQTVVPLADEPVVDVEFNDRPRCREGRVYVAQPGVVSLECLDMDTGQLVEHHEMLTASGRILGFVDECIVIHSGNAVTALNLHDFSVAWQLALSEAALEVALDNQSSTVIQVEPVSDSNGDPTKGDRTKNHQTNKQQTNKQQTNGKQTDNDQRNGQQSNGQQINGEQFNGGQSMRIRWFDAGTGESQSVMNFPSVVFQDLRAGPVMHYAGRLWVVVGGARQAERNLVRIELTRAGEP